MLDHQARIALTSITIRLQIVAARQRDEKLAHVRVDGELPFDRGLGHDLGKTLEDAFTSTRCRIAFTVARGPRRQRLDRAKLLLQSLLVAHRRW